MKNKHVCPYCSRKITYFTRLTEHNLGEHECKHCHKKSNIKQEKYMWFLLLGAAVLATLIMLFYILFSKNVNFENEETGAHGFLCFMFFGKGTEIKWMVWEALPFIAFYFISPLFMTFTPQNRFVEQTTSSIDLDIPGISMVDGGYPVVDGNTRIIPKADEEEYSGTYEDISSSSDMERTRAFDVNKASAETVINVTKPKTSVSASYSSDEPLRKIVHNEEVSINENDEVLVDWDNAKNKYMSDGDVKVKKSSVDLDAAIKKYGKGETEGSNYSANRKF